MNTITAKELRDNLGAIAKRVEAGEQIRVSYRNKLAFRLEPLTAKADTRKPMSGLEAFLLAPKHPSVHDPDKSIKQIYHDLLDQKYRAK